jgi:hypothetical protein
MGAKPVEGPYGPQRLAAHYIAHLPVAERAGRGSLHLFGAIRSRAHARAEPAALSDERPTGNDTRRRPPAGS